MAAIPLSKGSRIVTIIWYLASLLLISVLTNLLPLYSIGVNPGYSSMVIGILFLVEIYLVFLFSVFKWRDFRFAIAPYQADDEAERLISIEIEKFNSFYISILKSHGKKFHDKIREFMSYLFSKSCKASSGHFKSTAAWSTRLIQIMVTSTFIDQSDELAAEMSTKVSDHFEELVQECYLMKKERHPDLHPMDSHSLEVLIPGIFSIISIILFMLYFVGVNVSIF